jgi:hypothetical protein
VVQVGFRGHRALVVPAELRGLNPGIQPWSMERFDLRMSTGGPTGKRVSRSLERGDTHIAALFLPPRFSSLAAAFLSLHHRLTPHPSRKEELP